MAEALRTYINLMNNLSEATRNRAAAAGRAALAQVGMEEVAAETSDRVTKLADEIANAGRANRQMLWNLVGAEVEQLLARLGFARTDEVDLLRDELVELRARVDEAERAAAAAAAPAKKVPPKASAAKKSAAKRAAAKKAAAGEAATASTPPPAPAEE